MEQQSMYQFISRISKYGRRYYINIPLAIHPEITRHHGKKVLVTLKILDEE